MSKEKKSNESVINKEGMIDIFSDMRDQFSLMASEFKKFKDSKNQEMACLDDAMREVSLKLNFYEQRELNRVMDIDGLDTGNEKDIKQIVITHISSLGIEIYPSDIINAYVFTKRQKGSERKAIRVTFLHEFVKYDIMRKKIRMHRNKLSPVFFSHVLTRPNLAILMEGKKLKKENKIIDIKLLNGRLYVFHSDGKKILVECMDDLFQIVDDDKSSNITDEIKDLNHPPKPTSQNVQDSSKSTPKSIPQKISNNKNDTQSHSDTSHNDTSHIDNGYDSISPSTLNQVSKNDENISKEGRIKRNRKKKHNSKK